MSMDKISNVLSTVKNASMAGKSSVETAYFKQGKEVLDILKTKGLLKDVKIFKPEGSNFKNLRVDLADTDGAIRNLEIARVSKPGRRVYSESGKLLKVKGGFGVLVVSTSRGMMSGDEARKKNLGGEVICKAFFN